MFTSFHLIDSLLGNNSKLDEKDTICFYISDFLLEYISVCKKNAPYFINFVNNSKPLKNKHILLLFK